jgi:hypothetical protein
VTNPRRLLVVAVIVFVIAAIVTAIVVSRGASVGRPTSSPMMGSPSPRTPSSKPSPMSTSDSVRGLTVTGTGPVLSWDRLDHATTYHVTASGPGGRWMWGGYAARVLFGTLETDTDPVVRPDLPEVRVLVPKPGETYRWAVIAFSDKGDVVATSEIHSFTYAPPADQSLPPRAHRFSPPALACSKLIPEPLAATLFPGFRMQQSTPCGDALRGGCPLTCEYAKRDEQGTTRASFTFSCSDGDWAGYPKPKHGAALPGVGRAAQIATEDERTTILFHSTSTKCIVKHRSELPRDAAIATARQVDAQLVPGSLWMPDDWR